jgi:hypothetical protein
MAREWRELRNERCSAADIAIWEAFGESRARPLRTKPTPRSRRDGWPESTHGQRSLSVDSDRAKVQRMQPVAAKVLQEIRKAKRSQVVDLRAARELRDLTASLDQDEPDSADALPVQHAEWLSTFKRLTLIAHPLLGLRALRKLAERIQELEDEFMPGGPPMRRQ